MTVEYVKYDNLHLRAKLLGQGVLPALRVNLAIIYLIPAIQPAYKL